MPGLAWDTAERAGRWDPAKHPRDPGGEHGGQFTRKPAADEGGLGDQLYSAWVYEDDQQARDELDAARAAYRAGQYGLAANHVHAAAAVHRAAGRDDRARALDAIGDQLGGVSGDKAHAERKALKDAVKPFVAKAAPLTPGLLGGGVQEWNGTLSLADELPARDYLGITLAQVDWAGNMDMRTSVARNIDAITTGTGEVPAERLEDVTVPLHELIHTTIGGQWEAQSRVHEQSGRSAADDRALGRFAEFDWAGGGGSPAARGEAGAYGLDVLNGARGRLPDGSVVSYDPAPPAGVAKSGANWKITTPGAADAWLSEKDARALFGGDLPNLFTAAQMDDLTRRGFLERSAAPSGPVWKRTAKAAATDPPRGLPPQPSEGEQSYRWDSGVQAIEEGFTELGTIQHAADYFTRMGIGKRPVTGMLAAGKHGGPLENPAQSRRWNKLRADLTAARDKVAARIGAPVPATRDANTVYNVAALQDARAALDRAIGDMGPDHESWAGQQGIRQGLIDAELWSVMHTGDAELSATAARLRREAGDLMQTPVLRRATAAQLAAQRDDPDRIKGGYTWGHYDEWTKQAQLWTEEITALEGAEGAAARRRQHELADEINRESAEHKTEVMARQVLAAAHLPTDRLSLLLAKSTISDWWGQGAQVAAERARDMVRGHMTPLTRAQPPAASPWRTAAGQAAGKILDWVNGDPQARAHAGLAQLAQIATPDTPSWREVGDVARVVGRLAAGTGSVTRGLAWDEAERTADWDPKEHPRGRGGKFARKPWVTGDKAALDSKFPKMTDARGHGWEPGHPMVVKQGERPSQPDRVGAVNVAPASGGQTHWVIPEDLTKRKGKAAGPGAGPPPGANPAGVGEGAGRPGPGAGAVVNGKWVIDPKVKAGDKLVDGNGDVGTVAGVSGDGRWVAAEWDRTGLGGKNRREIIDARKGEATIWYQAKETAGDGQDWMRVVAGGVPRDADVDLGHREAAQAQALHLREKVPLVSAPGTDEILAMFPPRTGEDPEKYRARLAGLSSDRYRPVADRVKDAVNARLGLAPSGAAKPAGKITEDHRVAAGDQALGLAMAAKTTTPQPDAETILKLFPPRPGESAPAYRKRLGGITSERYAQAAGIDARGNWQLGQSQQYTTPADAAEAIAAKVAPYDPRGLLGEKYMNAREILKAYPPKKDETPPDYWRRLMAKNRADYRITAPARPVKAKVGKAQPVQPPERRKVEHPSWMKAEPPPSGDRAIAGMKAGDKVRLDDTFTDMSPDWGAGWRPGAPMVVTQVGAGLGGLKVRPADGGKSHWVYAHDLNPADLPGAAPEPLGAQAPVKPGDGLMLGSAFPDMSQWWGSGWGPKQPLVVDHVAQAAGGDVLARPAGGGESHWVTWGDLDPAYLPGGKAPQRPATGQAAPAAPLPLRPKTLPWPVGQVNGNKVRWYGVPHTGDQLRDNQGVNGVIKGIGREPMGDLEYRKWAAVEFASGRKMVVDVRTAKVEHDFYSAGATPDQQADYDAVMAGGFPNLPLKILPGTGGTRPPSSAPWRPALGQQVKTPMGGVHKVVAEKGRRVKLEGTAPAWFDAAELVPAGQAPAPRKRRAKGQRPAPAKPLAVGDNVLAPDGQIHQIEAFTGPGIRLDDGQVISDAGKLSPWPPPKPDRAADRVKIFSDHRSPGSQHLSDALSAGIDKHWSPGGQGSTSDVEFLTLNDGTEAVRKKFHVFAGSAEQQADAETLSGQVADAIGGTGAPAVVRTADDEVVSERIHGELAGDAWEGMYDPGDYTSHPEAFEDERAARIGLLDVITVQVDRHGHNWMIGDDGEPIPFDHGGGFGDNDELMPHCSPFAQALTDPEFKDSRWRFDAAELDRIEKRIKELKPEFDQSGHAEWYLNTISNLHQFREFEVGGAETMGEIHGGRYGLADIARPSNPLAMIFGGFG